MSQPDHWLRSMITSPESGLFVMLLICLQKAEEDHDRQSFLDTWVANPDIPNLYGAWLTMRETYASKRGSITETDYHYMPHGNIGNRNGTKRRKIKLDNKGEKW